MGRVSESKYLCVLCSFTSEHHFENDDLSIEFLIHLAGKYLDSVVNRKDQCKVTIVRIHYCAGYLTPWFSAGRISKCQPHLEVPGVKLGRYKLTCSFLLKLIIKRS
jgi:hypothetical protein